MVVAVVVVLATPLHKAVAHKTHIRLTQLFVGAVCFWAGWVRSFDAREVRDVVAAADAGVSRLVSVSGESSDLSASPK